MCGIFQTANNTATIEGKRLTIFLSCSSFCCSCLSCLSFLSSSCLCCCRFAFAAVPPIVPTIVAPCSGRIIVSCPELICSTRQMSTSARGQQFQSRYCSIICKRVTHRLNDCGLLPWTHYHFVIMSSCAAHHRCQHVDRSTVSLLLHHVPAWHGQHHTNHRRSLSTSSSLTIKSSADEPSADECLTLAGT